MVDFPKTTEWVRFPARKLKILAADKYGKRVDSEQFVVTGGRVSVCALRLIPAHNFNAPRPLRWLGSHLPSAGFPRRLPVRRLPSTMDCITIEGKVGKTFNGAAGLQPLDFNPIDFCKLSDTEHDSRVVGR